MKEEPQVCCYCIDGNKVCRKPLLDDGEVWLALLVAGVRREKGISYMSTHIQDADEGLAEFRRRFRMGLREVGDPESSGAGDRTLQC